MINKEFKKNFTEKAMCGFPIIYIQTYEYERTIGDVVFILQKMNLLNIYKWSKSSKFIIVKEEKKTEIEKAYSIEEQFDKILSNKSHRCFYIMRDLDRFLDDPSILAKLEETVTEIAAYNLPATIVIVSATPFIPTTIARQSTIINFPLPNREEIANIIKSVASAYFLHFDNTYIDQLCAAFAGMSKKEIIAIFYSIVSTSNLENRSIGQKDIKTIIEFKKEIVKKTGVVEIVPTNIKFEDVGGLSNLKKWVKERKDFIISPKEVEKYGLEPPKGILMFGVPGSGKSLTAKMIANYYELPLIGLNIGNLLSHKSPGNAMTLALDIAEAVSPCVLWMDEVEKMFAGTGVGSKDGGNAEVGRIFGILLTWMQEHTKPVFLALTSNDISRIEPTLYRDGRISERFYVGFVKSEAELKSIMEVHFRLRLKDNYDKVVKDLDYSAIFTRMKQMIARFEGEERAGYAGANIEALVVKTLERRYFLRKDTIDTRDIIYMLNIVKPQHGELIRIMQKKAEEMEAILA